MPQTLKGAAVARFVRERKAAIERARVKPAFLTGAIKALDDVAAHHPIWELDDDECPSLPARPSFLRYPDGRGFSSIPIPPEQRQYYAGRRRQKRWNGRGLQAWAHYLAAVDLLVDAFARPPEENIDLESQPAIPGAEALVSFIRRPDSRADRAFDALLVSPIVTATIRSEGALGDIRRQANVFAKFLAKQNCVRLDQITKHHLVLFWQKCRDDVVKGHKALRTVNGYLMTARRILGWVADHLEVPVPPAIKTYLRNVSDKDLGAKTRTGLSRVGVSETIAMPMKQLTTLLQAARQSEFEFALVMCSFNLAAGAKDLSNLEFEDRTSPNPRLVVDMANKLFFTRRGKTGINRWTIMTDQGPAIRMMKYTHQALAQWIAKRADLITDLAARRSLRERFELTREIRRLRAEGLVFGEIASRLGITEINANDLARAPANLAEYARMLRRNGHSLSHICELTGQAKGTVLRQTKDVVPQKECKDRGNRFNVVTPNENAVFFVPMTGRPLNHYVLTVFEGLCARAGIVRETDILAKRVQQPPPGTFILPKYNGQYIFRRTGATIAGMLGEVPERKLQSFMGHKNPEMTRRYIKEPPADYSGQRATHDYTIRISRCEDPVDAIEEFLDHILD